MFVELAKDLWKGIKNIQGTKFSGQKFASEADWNLYYEKVLQQNKKFISEDMSEYIAIRNTGAGWVSFKKESSLEAFKSALGVDAEAKKLNILGAYYDPDY